MATNAATPTRGPILPVARIREALVGYGFVLTDGLLHPLLHLAHRLRALHQPIRLGRPRKARQRRVGQLHGAVPRRALPARPREHARLHGRCRARADGARPPPRPRGQSGHPRPHFFPLRVLLPGDRLLGGDHGDLHLPLERRRVGEHRHRRAPAVVRRSVDGAVLVMGLNAWTTSATGHALLPRRAPVDPDGRLRGGSDRRRRPLANVLESHLPAAQAGPFLRGRRLGHRLPEGVRPELHRLARDRRARSTRRSRSCSTCTRPLSRTSSSATRLRWASRSSRSSSRSR